MELKTVEAVVSAFGGTAECARWCGLGPSAVSNWLKERAIPPGWHYRMFIELKRRGYDVGDDVFDPPSATRQSQLVQQDHP